MDLIMGEKEVRAECTEGCKEIDVYVDLFSGFENKPYVTFTLPHAILPDNYDGGGVFQVGLEDLLKSSIPAAIDFDNGEGSHFVTDLLRKYADVIDSQIDKYKKDRSDVTISNSQG